MSYQERTTPKAFLKKKRFIGLSCVCGLLLACAIVPSGCTKQVDVSIADYCESLSKEREKADNARKEWASRGAKREEAEKERLQKLSIPELSKEAVSLLARAEHPEYILAKAIDRTDKKIVIPPGHKRRKPEDHVWWTLIYREELDADHDWWIECHKLTKHCRLIGNPNQTVYFSILREKKLRTILINIVMGGNTRSFYQVVKSGTAIPQNGCELLTLDEAGKIFPETLNLGEGVYAQHPCNPYALVPLTDFHAALAMNKASECIVLLGRMGAKSVHVSREESETSIAGGGGGVSSMGYRATVDAELVKGMNSHMDLAVVFSGKPPVAISPTLLEHSVWHKNDAQMNAILSALLSGNKPTEWHFSEEMQSDFNFDFKAAASILGIDEANLKAKCEKTKQSKRMFHVVF